MHGPATYQLIRSFLAPVKPTSKTFAKLVTLVQEHQQPTPSPIVQRFNFNSRVQHAEESISEFVAKLRKLAEHVHCEYGESLDEMLRDRIVCGCKDKKLQCRLLAATDLTYAKALSTAKAMETAECELMKLQPPTANSPVYTLTRGHNSDKPSSSTVSQAGKGSSQPCYRCGGKHLASTCQFRQATCHYCSKVGHIAKELETPDTTPLTPSSLNTIHVDTPEYDPYLFYRTHRYLCDFELIFQPKGEECSKVNFCVN